MGEEKLEVREGAATVVVMLEGQQQLRMLEERAYVTLVLVVRLGYSDRRVCHL